MAKLKVSELSSAATLALTDLIYVVVDPGSTPVSKKAALSVLQAALTGKADLVAGKVPEAQLPSYVDDVIEAANFAALPGTGEAGKIYVTLDDGKTYRWSGSAYVVISDTLALGETSATAYRGDRGKAGYDHSLVTTGNPHGVTKSDVGLGNADNTSDANKPVSTAQQTALDGKMNNVTVSNKTDSYNIALSDFGNALTMNAATAKSFNLPADLSTVIGKTLTVTKLGAGKVTVQANTGQTIADGTSAGTIYDDQATELSASIVLQVISATQLMIVGFEGTWSTT